MDPFLLLTDSNPIYQFTVNFLLLANARNVRALLYFHFSTLCIRFNLLFVLCRLYSLHASVILM